MSQSGPIIIRDIADVWYSCKKCSEAFNDFFMLREHFLTKHKEINIIECNGTILSGLGHRGSLTSSMEQQRPTSPQIEIEIDDEDEVVEMEFEPPQEENSYEEVQQTHQVTRVWSQKNSCDFTLCPICGKEFPKKKSSKAYAQHMEVHEGKRPYCCPVCLKCYKDPVELIAHSTVHTNEEPFKCPHVHCKAAYKKIFYFENHLKQKHGCT